MSVSEETLQWAYSKEVETSITGNEKFEEYLQYVLKQLRIDKLQTFDSAIQLYLTLIPIVEGNMKKNYVKTKMCKNCYCFLVLIS